MARVTGKGRRTGTGGGTALQSELVRQILANLEQEGCAPGAAIRELPLAAAFGVSRTPVRAALRTLEGLGYVTFRPGHGFELKRRVNAGDVGSRIRLPRSVLDEVYEAILGDRAAGALPAEVSEAALMPRYGVSRGLVRRVLMRLSDEGLARRQRGHGWKFIEALDSAAAVAESYRFRMIVECAAVREPGFRADMGGLRRLREAHRLIIRDPAQLDRRRWFEVNSTFHETLAVWSGNRFLIEAVRRQNTLRRFSEFHAFQELTRERVLQSSGEHVAILDAIEAGDVDWAATLLQRHLALAERDYLDGVDGAAPPPVRSAGRSGSRGRPAPR